MTARITAMLFAASLACQLAGAVADEQTADASQLFEQGLELIEQARYEEAAIAFKTAYELAPNYKVLYNVGEAERLVGHHARALEAYSRYLTEGADEIDEERASYVRERVAELTQQVGQIQVKCAVPGAVVLIDDRPQGQTPLDQPRTVDAGQREVVVVKDGQELHREMVFVGGAQLVWVVVDLEPEPDLAPVVVPTPAPSGEAPAPAASAVEEPPVEPGDPRLVWTWVALGATVAAGATAAVTGNLALSEAREIDLRCEGNTCPGSLADDADRAERLALTADIRSVSVRAAW
jgi:hypothetical protein